MKIGRNVSINSVDGISIGNRTTIGDYCRIQLFPFNDQNLDKSIQIGKEVVLSRSVDVIAWANADP